MKRETTQRVIIGVVGLAVAVTVWWVAQRRPLAFTREIQGTVIAVDPAARTASLEFPHPRTGELLTLEGSVPADCEIRVNGKPATIADVHVGDVVRVKGHVDASKHITARWVHIQRPATTQPSDVTTTQSA
jgi:hypothetical protein